MATKGHSDNELIKIQRTLFLHRLAELRDILVEQRSKQEQGSQERRLLEQQMQQRWEEQLGSV